MHNDEPMSERRLVEVQVCWGVARVRMELVLTMNWNVVPCILLCESFDLVFEFRVISQWYLEWLFSLNKLEI